MAIKFAFFDIYGTLATFYPPREQIQQQAAAEFGINLTVEGITAGYLVADRIMGDQNALKPIRKMNKQEQEAFFTRFEQAVLEGDGHVVSSELARKIWLKVKSVKSTFKLYDDVVHNLIKIKELGVTCAVISNMNYPGTQLEQEFGQPELLSFIVTSRDVGYEKPHPQIFQYALQRCNATKSETIYVGDQVMTDIEGAKGAGIRPILLDRYGAHAEYGACSRVTSMDELYQLLHNAGKLLN